MSDRTGKCVLCGHDPSCGFASITHNGTESWLCHEDDHSCYHAWTVWGVRDAEDLNDLNAHRIRSRS